MANTLLTGLTPMMICKDVQAQIQFFCDILEFDVQGRMDDVGATGWASLTCGSIEIMLASPTYIPSPKPVNGKLHEVTFYFYSSDVVEFRRRVLDKGYPVSELAVRFYGMKECELVDPEGHLLVFGQDTDEPPTPE